MDYVREYKRFINSHYLNGAIRITAGITLPAILLGYFHNLSTGIVVSIGAMCVANTDNPGPIHHRRNGMIACILIIFLVSLITGLAIGTPVWMGLIVLLFCFVFSLMSIYGNRAYADPSYGPVVDAITRCLGRAVVILQDGGTPTESGGVLKKERSTIVKPIEDQFGLIGKVAGDILRLSPVLHAALT